MEDNFEKWATDNLTFVPYEHEKHGYNIRTGSVLIVFNGGRIRTILVGDVNHVLGECDCCSYIKSSNNIISIANIEELSKVSYPVWEELINGSNKKD